MPDNYSQWESHEAKQEKWLNSLPVCNYCGHPIQDEKLFDFDGDCYHVDCITKQYLKWTEDYIA